MQKKSGIMESGLDAMPFFLLDNLLTDVSILIKFQNFGRQLLSLVYWTKKFPLQFFTMKSTDKFIG